jgi:hypothetical protein
VDRNKKCSRDTEGIDPFSYFPRHPPDECKWDYRVIGKGVSFSATNRPHLKAVDYSQIIQHTC